MGPSTRRSAPFRPSSAVPLLTLGLLLACSSADQDEPVDEGQSSGRGGQGSGSGGTNAGGTSASGGSQASAGGATTGGSGVDGGTSGGSFSPPPCNPEDNTLKISTDAVLTNLPGTMTFTVVDPPGSKRFTGYGSNGDVRVYLPEPATMDRVLRTATVVDPLDRVSANVELVLASGFVNARYVVDTGAELYAQVSTGRTVLTLCDVPFYPATDPLTMPMISVTGRLAAAAP